MALITKQILILGCIILHNRLLWYAHFVDCELYFSILLWALAAGGGPCPPWIFIHGTNVVDKSFAIFSVFFL